jgi:hypothetical protein
VDKAKIEVIEQLLPPTNVKGIHNFLGHARPLTHLIDKDAPFIFMKECLQSFHTLKKALVSARVV